MPRISKPINAQLIEICNSQGLTYIDLDPTFSDENGKLNKKYSIDGLHVNGAGYVIWKELITQYLD